MNVEKNRPLWQKNKRTNRGKESWQSSKHSIGCDCFQLIAYCRQKAGNHGKEIAVFNFMQLVCKSKCFVYRINNDNCQFRHPSHCFDLLSYRRKEKYSSSWYGFLVFSFSFFGLRNSIRICDLYHRTWPNIYAHWRHKSFSKLTTKYLKNLDLRRCLNKTSFYRIVWNAAM